MNLRKKLSIAIFVVVTITLVLFQIVTTVLNQTKLTEDAKKAAESTSTRLGVTIADSMWNYNIEAAKNIASAELGTNDLVEVTALNLQDELLFKIVWDENNAQVTEQDFQGNVSLTLDKVIQFKDQSDLIDAGKIRLTFSSTTIESALNESIIKGIIQIVILQVTLILVVNWFIVKLIVRPLEIISTRVKDIAEGDGDLTQRVNYQSSDELGVFAQNINRFISNVQTIVIDIVGVSKVLDSSATDSQTNVDQLNTQAEDLNNQVAMILEAIEALDQTALDVARQASQTSQITMDTSLLASEGMDKVNGATLLIRSLSDNMQESTDKTAMLEKHSQSIDTVIQVIKGIAEQTNLLALNAAIEAARAGEQGRGFAVVADEVRTLAQRTQDSTGQITEIIETLQAQSAEMLQVMQNGQKLVAENVESVNQAEQTFSQIKTSIESNLSGAQLIAQDTDSQKSTLRDIKQNLESIKDTNDKTLEVAKRSANVNQQIVEMSQTVTQLSEKFKI